MSSVSWNAKNISLCELSPLADDSFILVAMIIKQICNRATEVIKEVKGNENKERSRRGIILNLTGEVLITL